VDGVYIAGACQAPKSAAESVTSALAAVAKTAAVLKRGSARLEPLVATVDPARCTWCGACEHACPYDAIRHVGLDGKAVAVVDAASCKGCGACGPICPESAIDLLGHTDEQMRATIGALQEAVG
jgi:heterodisulfide reductase subunit A2